MYGREKATYWSGLGVVAGGGEGDEKGEIDGLTSSPLLCARAPLSPKTLPPVVFVGSGLMNLYPCVGLPTAWP